MADRSLLRRAPESALIAPSILSADFAHLGDECRQVLEGGADLLHLDVMDGHFAPNLTMGPALCAAIARELPSAFLDVHLMVTDPERFVDPFVKAGAHHLTFHIEAVPEPAHLARRIRSADLTAGLAINPATPVDAVLPWLDHFDLILVMSVVPGFSGQAFKPEVLGKVRRIAEELRTEQRLEMDGGIGPANAPECCASGCDVLVAATAIFGERDRRAAVRALRGSTIRS